MNYFDRIHGPCVIDEPVICELINSPSLQRLKHISQGGYEPYLHADDHTRFHHSLGVFLLLRMYGAPLEEQIAGLVHDISHSAFSHCIDYVIEGGSEKEHSHQDRLFESFIKRSEIPAILHRYGIDVEYIIDDQHFPLKETLLPDLCADRIDYSLRTALIFGERSPADVQAILDALIVYEKKWVFTNVKSAQTYAELFAHLNQNLYSGISSAIMFRCLGDYLKYALRCGYISEADLYTTDPQVLAKVKFFHAQDRELVKLWRRMNREVPIHNSPEAYEAVVFCKSRVVDPLFISSHGVQRVSDVDTQWKAFVEQECHPKKYFLAFHDEP